MARVRAVCKAMTAGATRGKAYRLGEDMAEAEVTTQTVSDTQESRIFQIGTLARMRLFADGSGLFEFTRGRDKFSLRWTEEEKSFEVFANFDGVEGVLVPDECKEDHTPNKTTKKAMKDAQQDRDLIRAPNVEALLKKLS